MFNNFDEPQQYGRSDKELVKSQDAQNIINILLHQEELGVKLTDEQKARAGYFLTRYVTATLTSFEADLESHDASRDEELSRPGINRESERVRKLIREQNDVKTVKESYKMGK